MIVYRLDWLSSIDGNRIKWFPCLDDAHEWLKQRLIEDPYICGNAHARAVQVPTHSRKALLEWLNDSFTSANV